MTGLTRLSLVIAGAVLCASCGDVVPSRTTSTVDPSPAVLVETPAPTAASIATPTAPAPSPMASATPPYRLDDLGSDMEGRAQEPGTIIFGALSGPVSDARIEPFWTWPDGGMTYEFRFAFGAFWGGPARAPQIRITLYRLKGGTLDRVWSDVKDIDPDATGYLDTLVPFDGPGTFRLEVTRSSDLLAWGVAHLGPKCESDCSGG